MEQKQILKAIMDKGKVSANDIKKQLNEEFDKLDKSIPEETRKILAFNRVVSSYRKILTSRAQQYTGIIIGSTSPRDMVKSRRDSALEMYKTNKEDSVKRGITNEQGVPLYYSDEEELAKMPDFMKQRIGQPLPESDVQNVVFAACKNDNGKYITTVLRLRGNNTKVKLPMFVEGGFSAFKLQSSTDDVLRVNDSGMFHFEPIGSELSEEQLLELLNTTFKDRFIKLNQIDTFLQQHPEFERFCFMKVMVTEIIPTLTSTGSQQLRVQDETIEFLDEQGNIIPPIMCFIPSHISLNFQEKSEVYIVGQPNVTERGKNINVLGIFVPLIYRNKVPVIKTEEEEAYIW